ncbi:hypothetical protein [Novosphingobium sp.]|uniref:hypothetical protein n=1 Tax=Novosphingobium sp. TaxID=1874826 RepID=UPI0038BD20C2
MTTMTVIMMTESGEKTASVSVTAQAQKQFAASRYWVVRPQVAGLPADASGLWHVGHDAGDGSWSDFIKAVYALGRFDDEATAKTAAAELIAEWRPRLANAVAVAHFDAVARAV